MSTPALAVVGHNSQSVLDIVEADPAAIYREEGLLAKVVEEIEKDIASREVDLSTTKARDEIKTRAADVSRLKATIEKAGLALTEGWRDQTNAVNRVKSKAKDELDRLRDLARKPLTEWENERQKRADQIETALQFLDGLAVVPPGATSGEIRATIAGLSQLAITEGIYGHMIESALIRRDRALNVLNSAALAAEQAERDAAELAKLREEQCARDEADRAERERQAALDAEREREARAHKAATEKAEREAAERVEAAKREAQRQIAEANRRLEEQAAAEAKRIADERRVREDADARRRDVEHRSAVMRAVKEAIMEHAGVKEDAAKKIVQAILAGSIPHTSITF